MAETSPNSGKNTLLSSSKKALLSDASSLKSKGPEQTYYECGAGRKTFFCFAFVLLLPFYISLPAMLFQRLINGLWLDTWQLMVLAALFTVLMVLILFETIFSLRAEVDVGEKSLAFTLPSGGGGALPWLAYETRDIPYEDIISIEKRHEVFGGRYAPMMMESVRLILNTGETVPLGRTNEKDDDPKFPFPAIAQQVAERAGTQIVDRGHISVALHRRVLGMKDGVQSRSGPEITELNSKHNTFLVALSSILAILLALGIVGDFFQETVNYGERARSSVVAP